MMGETKRAPSSFRNALPGRVVWFATENGLVAVKDEHGRDFRISRGRAFSVRWKDNIVGNPYGAFDEVAVYPGDMVMCMLPDSEFIGQDTLTVLLPPASAAGGQDILFINMSDKKTAGVGELVMVPGSGDQVGNNSADAPVTLSAPSLFGAIMITSNGINKWSLSSTIGGDAVIPYPPVP